jgi:acetyl esterase/lipase
MRFLRGAIPAFGLGLLLAAAVLAPVTWAQGLPDAALRLTPIDPMPVPAPQPPPAAPVPTPQSFGPQRISYTAGVTATFDLVYANLRGYRPLTLDLYLPGPRGLPAPLVVFVHGGGWNGGDSRHAAGFDDFPRVLAALAAQGYIVASVSYRLSGEARFPAAVQDIKTAIRWLRSRAHELNMDDTRVAVWGDGAGGQLAALTGVTCGVAAFDPETPRSDTGDAPSSCVQAVIDWYGISDLQSLAADNQNQPQVASNAPNAAGFQPPPTSDAGSFLGCEPASCPPMVARLASPLSFISGSAPPFLIQHGEADTTISLKQSQKLHEALRKANVPAELITYPGAGYNFARANAADRSTHQAAMEKLTGFLSAIFPAVPLGSRSASQPRGSLY